MKYSAFLLIPLSLLCLSCRPASHGTPTDRQTVRFLTAKSLYLKGDSEKALSLFEELYRESPGYRENARAYARALLYSGHPEDALCIASENGRYGLPEMLSIDSIKIMAEACLMLGRYKQAEALLEEGLSLSSGDVRLLYLLALCREAAGQYDEAITLLESAGIMAERDCEITIALARIYASQGMSERAGEQLETSLRMAGPDHPLTPVLTEMLKSFSQKTRE